jgi:hypothetical protein
VRIDRALEAARASHFESQENPVSRQIASIEAAFGNGALRPH